MPVTSYKIKKPDNFLICADNGSVVSSLRFNYMFPVPADAITSRIIDTEPDVKYKALLSQELRYCIKNQDEIRHLAERTYKRVLLGQTLSNPRFFKCRDTDNTLYSRNKHLQNR